MRSLDRARQRALTLRPVLGDELDARLERLTAYFDERHQIRPLAVGSDFLHGGRGEVAPAEGLLYYDRKLDGKPDEKLELFAHELGHLVLHQRLANALVPGDPIRGSAFLEHGTPALARYSRRSYEEAEATAFAAELLCPADEVFAAWRAVPAATTTTLAARFGVSLGLARVQLAEGLYRFVRGPAGAAAGGDELTTNPDQEEAALWSGSPVLVEAGPGTGKTRTLVRRVIHLVRERGAAPEDLLVLTFSNEAAEELRQRLARSLGQPAEEVLIATFHGLGMHLLHSYGHLLGLGSDVTVLDDVGKEELLIEVLGRVDCEAILNLFDPQVTARRAAHEIGYLKDRLVTPARLAEEIARWQSAEGEAGEHARALALQRVFQAYEDEKQGRDRVDFADLMLLPLVLLAEHDEVRQALRKRFRWVMVDEYQDVSRSMATLLSQLCGPDNPPWVVGDARQAIYRFRGAAPENVRRFAEDFPGARTFLIGLNYRASPPIVDAANQLAALMEGEDADPPRRRWRPGRGVEPLATPVAVAATSSDAAERQTLVEQVRSWIERGVAPGDIGVLARRNIDVRNAALALAAAGIRAVTSGLVTAEGAAGDLAAAATALGAPRAAVPRLVYALGRGRAAVAELNAAVRHLLAAFEQEGEDQTGKEAEDDAALPPAAREVVAAVRRAFDVLRPLEHSGDGWAVLLTFLFDAGDYLRRLVGDGLGAAVALEEIVSALAFAGTYRFGHPGTPPRRSRARMAERLRDLLCNAAPGLIPPRPHAGAVRVMTCHASKGLEFPCVLVAGQTLNAERADAPWLPPALRHDPEEDRKQADSLLFVGVTRAQRAVAVSYAGTAGGTVRSPRRTLPRLLELWIASGAVPVRSVEIPPEPSEPVTLGPIWGDSRPETVSLYGLLGRQCGILGYLQEHLGIGFRPVLRPLYPVFVTRLRRALRRVVDKANEQGRRLAPEEAEAIAAEEWPDDKYAEHPHVGLYRPRSLRWARELARAYEPPAGGAESLDHDVAWEAGGEPASLPLQLIGRYRDGDGTQHALLFRPESLGGDGVETLKWSDLREHHRLPLALLGDDDPELRPRVYSGSDARIYPYRWSHQKPRETLAKVEGHARELLDLRSRGVFQATIKDWTCDRCPCRMLCPFWMEAAEE